MAKKTKSAKSRLRATKRAAYKLAAGAVVATSCAAESEAAVQYFEGPIDVPQEIGQPIDLNLDNYTDIVLKNYIFNGGNYQGATVSFYPGKTVGFSTNGPAISGEYMTALSVGTFIDSSSLGPSFYGSMAYGALNPNAQFNNITDGYIGFAFPIGPTDLYFAWMRVDVDNAAGTLLIKDWAYEDQTGVGITVGDMGTPLFLADFDDDGDVDGADFLDLQRGFGGTYNSTNLVDWQTEYGMSSIPMLNSVPEPGTLGLLAAGACGLSFWRKRRADQNDRAHEDQA
ncbi:PEP-CTERM sorting domain-containing protein [Bythopirellula goksoeyrii]|uniref:PEP-CTERM motif protein n=1 Tax=Bythopirellula goksoeyrii TaxID=1400387 RepID=A0A5B9QHL9_9BACT|nr:PEP-CTERM sorting domain-containing protein [Bythopirellula goksoeyrii]QEG37439.1 PEP-CTERM motif protein [Bythopirellula goksoeyrii]